MSPDELAAKYLPQCKALAHKIAAHKGRPHESDQAQSVAVLKLALMIAEHDPDDGPDGFGRFVKYQVAREVNTYFSRDRPKGRVGGHGPKPLLAESLPGPLGDADEWQPSGEPPVGWEVDAEDAIRGLAARLPARHGEVIVARYLHADARKPGGCAARMGMSKQYVAKIHREALDMLRVAIAAGGRVAVTPSPERVRACGKIVHASRDGANASISSLRRKGRSNESRRPLTAYRCGPCGGWHVGHRPQTSGHLDAT